MNTRIFCSRSSNAHQIAGITADAGGLLLTYRDSVHTTPDDPKGVKSPQDGWHYLAHGGEREQRAPTDEVLTIDLWCSGCRTGHPVNAGQLFEAARRGRKKITLTSRGAWEGLWED
jgi:hypothetical protein